MTYSVTLTGVANSDVPRIKADYEHQGATVTVTPDGAGTSTVVATWPDATNATAAASTHAAVATALTGG